MSKEPVLVSACLLGIPCRYDGQSKSCSDVTRLAECFRLIPVCPEVLGGLPTPREPSEIQPDGSVQNRIGNDVTAQYRAGAEATLALALENRCRIAILKERSPSCGCGRIYDGSFSGVLTSGDGITARLLCQNGIRVLGESEIAAISGGKIV